MLLISCMSEEEKALEIVNRSIEAHGCDVFSRSVVSFDFRDRSYSVWKNSTEYVYTRTWEDSTGTTIDSLVNSSQLTRYLNDSIVNLTEEWEGKYASSVNSVLYFFQLPCLLNDPAVLKKYVGSTIINGVAYDQVEVGFQAEGGGEDFEDVYMYWFNQNTSTMDYLAYNYQVEGGGTRFRKAVNKRVVNGLIVQDYINYKSEEKFPPLTSLPSMLEKEELIELSQIINTNVQID
jgi:hypothetical protein